MMPVKRRCLFVVASTRHFNASPGHKTGLTDLKIAFKYFSWYQIDPIPLARIILGPLM